MEAARGRPRRPAPPPLLRRPRGRWRRRPADVDDVRESRRRERREPHRRPARGRPRRRRRVQVGGFVVEIVAGHGPFSAGDGAAEPRGYCLALPVPPPSDEVAGEDGARLSLESGPMAVRTWTALSPHAQQRALEIAPGALTWTVLLVPLIVAFAIRFNDPADLWILELGAVLLDAYWFLRTAVTVFWVWRSLKRAAPRGGGGLVGRVPATGDAGGHPRSQRHHPLRPHPHLHRALRGAPRHRRGARDQRYPDQLKVCAIITRATDIAGCDNVRRLQPRARPPIPRLHPHQGPAAARDRGGQVGRHVLRRSGAAPALRPAGARSGAHPGHRPRLRLPPAPSVLRPHHLELPARGPPADLDLATGAGLPQQPLEGAGGGQGDGHRGDPVADVPSPAPRSPGDVLLLHHVDEAADRGGLLGQRRHPRGLAVLLEGLLPLRRGAQGAARLPAGVRRRTPARATTPPPT